MNTRKFLETVWPPSGPYCIATPWVKPDGERCYAHRGCDTIDDAIAYILKMKSSKDLYFAPHTLKVVRTLNPKTGKLQTFRTHENMREARDFFFDIDAGGPKDRYATQDDILGALEQFLFETSLPSPFVINSGYGIHVHWIIDTPIESITWKEPAARLRWLAQEHGLHVDPSRTTDQSSVLRVPGTFNYKDPGKPRKVAILAEGAAMPAQTFLDQLNQLTSSYTPMAHKPGPRAQGSEILSVAWDGRRPTADEVAHVCEHMRVFRDSQGDVPEPAWHVGIGTIKHCDDGEAAAHKWSSGYPKYTEAETQKKLDAWTKPPPGCDKINSNSGDPAICAKCPHRDLAKNPVLIANEVYRLTHQPAQVSQNVTPNDPTPPCGPPEPFTLDMTYGIKVKGKKGGLICPYPMYPIQWVAATANESCLSRWRVKRPLTGWDTIEILNDEQSTQTLLSALRNKSIFILPNRIRQMQTFLPAYLRELQKYQESLKQYDYLGWETPTRQLTDINKPTESKNPKWFIHYNRKISVADGSIEPCVMTKNTQFDGMGKEGSLDQQIKLMEFYNDPAYMAQQFIIGASLATPFFKYSGHHGILICLTGDTGASKSTGLYVASSLWGHPKLYGLSGLRSKGTDKGRQEREVICANLPFMVDEITKFDKETAHEIALAADQAGPYISLKANRDIRQGRGGYKSNLTICTSNESLMQKVNNDSSGGQAGIMRVFEIKVSRNTIRSKIEADTLMRLLVENYGWIGEDFLQRCVHNSSVIEGEFLKIKEELERDISVSPEERLITACATIALLGIKLGRQLGYFQFNYKAMREWLINVQIPAMRDAARIERENSAPENIFYEYMETINHNTCRVNKNSRKETEVIYAPPTIECKARYEIHNAVVFVRIGSFIKHCTDHRYDHANILNQLEAKKIIIHKRKQKRMREENGTLGPPVMCFIARMPAASPMAVKLAAPPDDGLNIVEFKKSKP